MPSDESQWERGGYVNFPHNKVNKACKFKILEISTFGDDYIYISSYGS